MRAQAVAFGGGGVELEVVDLQRLQSHGRALWVKQHEEDIGDCISFVCLFVLLFSRVPNELTTSIVRHW